MLIRARMRVGAAWSDVCIVNLSSRGLGLQAASPPPRGTYVEVRRGSQVMVARVAWTKSRRFGVKTQDTVNSSALIGGNLANPADCGPLVERRQRPRVQTVTHEQSRWQARVAEFACLALLGGAAATIVFGAVETVLAEPMSRVETALASGPAG